MADLISIIVPVYNIAEYVKKTLDSILASTYSNIEVICVNDGSTDNSLQVVQEQAQKDERIRVFDKPNGGVTSARLFGLEQARGEWISFIDGDDVIDADMYQRLLDNVADEETDISHCGYKKIFLDGSVKFYQNTGKKLIQDHDKGVYDLLEGAFIEPGLVTKIYRKFLFEGIAGWLDASIKINEDLLMNYYLFRNAKKSVYEDFCPYSYILRFGSASTSAVNNEKLYDPIKVIDLLIEETQNDKELQAILQNRLIYLLVSGATREHNKQKDIVLPFRRYALKRLRNKLKTILKEKIYTKKMKCSALWVCIWPASYRWAHIVYGKLAGRYKKQNGISIWS